MIHGNATGSRQLGGYLNGVLTAIALLLVVAVVQRSIGLPGPSEAAAQRTAADRSSVRDNSSKEIFFPNASEQRNRMIAALEGIDARLKSIESRLAKAPLEVKVVEMPAQPQERQTAE